MKSFLNLPICNSIPLDNVDNMFLYIAPKYTGEETISLGLILYSKKKSKIIDKHFTTAIIKNDGLIRLNLQPKRHTLEVVGQGYAAWVVADDSGSVSLHIEQGYRVENFKLDGIVPNKAKNLFPEH